MLIHIYEPELSRQRFTRGGGVANNDNGNVGNNCRHGDVNGANPILVIVALLTLYL